MSIESRLRAANAAHRALLKLSGGKFGWRIASMPVLELTTIGRKSGRAHRVMLTSPVQIDHALVIVASRGGDDRHPAWFLNLCEQPRVTVACAGQPAQPMHARLATDQERAELWPRVIAAYKGYAAYQRKTAREIPLVFLEATNYETT